ncbi:MAG: hypothetical protein EZS28_015666, partial [Streblomastix strix]
MFGLGGFQSTEDLLRKSSEAIRLIDQNFENDISSNRINTSRKHEIRKNLQDYVPQHVLNYQLQPSLFNYEAMVEEEE